MFGSLTLKASEVIPLPCGCAQARSSRSRGCFVRRAGKHVKRSEQKPYRRSASRWPTIHSSHLGLRFSEIRTARCQSSEGIAIPGRSHPRAGGNLMTATLEFPFNLRLGGYIDRHVSLLHAEEQKSTKQKCEGHTRMSALCSPSYVLQLLLRLVCIIMTAVPESERKAMQKSPADGS